ncbi:MAG: acetyltransferase [Firmicutes bacterium]|nr:acetyltransferase [Bacillota bacterium]
MNKKLLLIGGGGHCKSVLDSILEHNEYDEIGIIDKKETIGRSIMNIPVIGCDDDLLALFSKGFKYAFVTVGSIGDPSQRIKIFTRLCDIGFEIPIVIDSTATISNYAILECGVFVGKQSIINSGAHVHKGAIINSGAIIEHDCQIGAFVHIAPGAVLGGEVIIDENTHVGSNSTIKQQVHIGSDSIIGMGSVVLKNIQKNKRAYGNPCKEEKKR